MPVLTSSGPPAVNDLAQRLAADLNAGRVARQSFGDRSTAFQWSAGLPQILATQVSSAVVDGLSFNAVRVAPSGTPAAKVAEGGTKPSAVTISSEAVALDKYAGIANFTTERQLEADGLTAAVAAVITRSCLLAFDADCMAVLDADAGLAASGADWPGAILAGSGEVASAGGAPDVLVLAADDYAAAVMSPGVGYAQNPADGAVNLFGLRIVLSGALAAGKGYVLDSAAVMAVENAQSPLAVVDPYSGLSTNECRIAVEAFMGFVVVNPGGIAEVTKTAAGE